MQGEEADHEVAQEGAYHLEDFMRIRDAEASTTFIRNPILIMENSDLGGCETLETPNIFLFPSVLSFIIILIWSCFILERFISPSQSRSCFI